MQNKKIIAIIPARAGSKGIPNKNIKELAGKPLIVHPIELAKSIKEINRIIISTDSEEIAKIAKQHGAEVPFIRPPELAKDDTPTLPVIQHCIKYMEEKEQYKPDLILLLYPTCPLLKKETVQKAIELFNTKNCNSVISVTKDYGRYWGYNEEKATYTQLYPKKRVNRQYFKPLYKENGAIYFSNYNTIIEKGVLVDNKNIQFIIMDDNDIIDIDTQEDWNNAEQRIQDRK